MHGIALVPIKTMAVPIWVFCCLSSWAMRVRRRGGAGRRPGGGPERGDRLL